MLAHASKNNVPKQTLKRRKGLKQQEFRVLEVPIPHSSSAHPLLDGVEEIGSHHTIHHAVVAAERDLHRVLHQELALVLYASRALACPTLVRHHGLRHAAHSQNARLRLSPPSSRHLRRIDDGGEGGDVVHAQVADRHAARLRLNAPPIAHRVLLGQQLALLALADQALHLLVQTHQPRLVHVAQQRRDQPVGDGHRHVDVDRLVVAHHVVDVAAVRLGHLRLTPPRLPHVAQRHRAGLHDEVVDRDLRGLCELRLRVVRLGGALLEVVVEAGAQLR